MPWMKVRDSSSNINITCKIFEFNYTYWTQHPYNYVQRTKSDGTRIVCVRYSNMVDYSEAEAVNLFPAGWVSGVDDDNSIIKFNHSWEKINNVNECDAPMYVKQVGVKPDKWNSAPWLYYTKQIVTYDGESYCMYNPVSKSATNIPTWDNSTIYYECDTNPRKRFFTRYTTDTGCSFAMTRAWFKSINRPDKIVTSASLQLMGEYESSESNWGNWYNASMQNLGYDIPSGTWIDAFQQEFSADNQSNIFTQFIHSTINNVDYYGVAIMIMNMTAARPYPKNFIVYMIPVSFWGTSISNVPPPYPSNWGDDSTFSGGNGTFTGNSDNRGETSGTTASTQIATVNTAILSHLGGSRGVKIYNPSSNQLEQIFGVIYTTNFIDQFLQSRFNPLSCILTYNLIPSRFISSRGTSLHCTAAGYDISAQTTLPDEDKFIPLVNMLSSSNIGSYIFSNRFFDGFPDFAPYTKIYLHLPYIGTIEINANDVMYGYIAVAYTCDVISGNVIAWISCSDKDENKKIITAQGNCAFTLPVFADYQGGQAIGKLISGAAGIGIAALGGMGAGALAGSALGVGVGVADAATRRDVKTSGTFGGNAGIISDTVCYLEIVRPVWCNPADYQKLNGIPCHVSGSISEFVGDERGGFLRIESIDLSTSLATSAEIEEIENILKDGIFYKPES